MKFENLDFTDEKVRNSFGKIKDVRPYIQYTPWITATGRLSTVPNSFPILNLNKELRPAIVPKNDALVELDYNAAELRTLLALSGKEQPKEDLHEWNRTNVYKRVDTREKAKKRIFAWLYNPESKDKLSSRVYDRDKVKAKYFDGSHVTTDFDRKIACEDRVALNYIIQSTTADLFLRQMNKIYKMLEDRKSFIAFSLHDSLVLDFSKEDLKNVPELVTMFSNTDLGQYLTNVSIGKNFGEMKKWKL